jgi:hypothetical protein
MQGELISRAITTTDGIRVRLNGCYLIHPSEVRKKEDVLVAPLSGKKPVICRKLGHGVERRADRFEVMATHEQLITGKEAQTKKHKERKGSIRRGFQKRMVLIDSITDGQRREFCALDPLEE